MPIIDHFSCFTHICTHTQHKNICTSIKLKMKIVYMDENSVPSDNLKFKSPTLLIRWPQVCSKTFLTFNFLICKVWMIKHILLQRIAWNIHRKHTGKLCEMCESIAIKCEIVSTPRYKYIYEFFKALVLMRVRQHSVYFSNLFPFFLFFH